MDLASCGNCKWAKEETNDKRKDEWPLLCHCGIHEDTDPDTLNFIIWAQDLLGCSICLSGMSVKPVHYCTEWHAMDEGEK